jgi:DNA-binding FadR family transcriptional regulator
MDAKELTRESLAEQVANSLREHIYASMAPGDYLPSTAMLVDEYQVSRIVIREALKYLEAQDILEISNGRLARVKPISSSALRTFFKRATSFDERKTLLELLEVRRGIEIESAGLAAERRTEEELILLQAIIDEMKQSLYEPEPYSRLDFELHQKVAKAAHNSMLIFLVETIHEAQRETILHGLYSQFTDSYFLEIQDIHSRIVSAIAAQDKNEARRTMVEHFDFAERAIRKEISNVTDESSET